MIPTCVKCGNHIFGLIANQTPMGSQFKVHYVACSSCGGVVGVLDYYSTGTIAVHIAKVALAIAKRVGASVEYGVSQFIDGLG